MAMARDGSRDTRPGILLQQQQVAQRLLLLEFRILVAGVVDGGFGEEAVQAQRGHAVEQLLVDVVAEAQGGMVREHAQLHEAPAEGQAALGVDHLEAEGAIEGRGLELAEVLDLVRRGCGRPRPSTGSRKSWRPSMDWLRAQAKSLRHSPWIHRTPRSVQDVLGAVGGAGIVDDDFVGDGPEAFHGVRMLAPRS